MTEPPRDLTSLILHGDVRAMLRELPERSVQCVVTSPPYWGLRAYGTAPQVWGGKPAHEHVWVGTPPRRDNQPQQTISGEAKSAEHTHNLTEQNWAASTLGGGIPEGQIGPRLETVGGYRCECGAWLGELGMEPEPGLFVDHLALVFAEVRRVLRGDGTLWLNLGDTYAGGSPVRSDAKRKFQRATDDDYIEFGGEGNQARPPCGVRPKNLVGIPWRVAFRLQADGWFLRSDCVWAKPNPMPESVTDRPTRAHEYIFLLTKNARYFYDADAVRSALAPSTEDWARNHYSNAADNPDPDSKHGAGNRRAYPVLSPAMRAVQVSGYSRGMQREIADGYDGAATKDYAATGAQDPSATKARIIAGARARLEAGFNSGSNLKTVWVITTQAYPDAHFATFPEEIPARCIKLGTSEWGACSVCGAPWERDTLRKTELMGGSGAAGTSAEEINSKGKRAGVQYGTNIKLGPVVRVSTVGWVQGCECGDARVVPCIVLDPFCGSGTTLEVARSLSRRSIGVELNPEYVKLARRRSSADTPDLSRFA